MKKKTARKIETILHLLTAVILILKGAEQIRKQVYFPSIVICILALAVLAVTFLWKPLRLRPRQAKVTAYYIESPALLLTAYALHMEGREFLPHFFIIAGIMYPVTGFIASKRFKRIKKADF